MLFDIKDRSDWVQLQQLRANMGVLLRYTNVMPFKWVSNTLKCLFCTDKKFADIAELRAHCTTDHKGFHSPDIIRLAISRLKQIRVDISDLSCKHCAAPFDDVHILTKHLVEMHNVKYAKGLERYLFQVNLNEDKVKCMVCGVRFEFLQNLVIHSTQQHEQGTFLCDTCGQGFEFEYKLASHKSVKHMEIKCDYCEKTFTNFTNKKAHEARHHKTRCYDCKECGSSFDTHHKMRRHAFLEHDQGTRYTCKECSMTFLYRKMLQQHMKHVHLKERQQCPICNAMVAFLKDHMVCHSDAKPYVCDVCQKAFARKKNLVAHSKTHKKNDSDGQLL